MKRSSTLLVAAVLTLVAGQVQAQQVPIPQTAADVTGPAPGPVTNAYLQMVGRMAYVRGRLRDTKSRGDQGGGTLVR